MSNPTYSSDPASEGVDPPGPGYEQPYGQDTPVTTGDPYASNVVYEPIESNAPVTGGYAGTTGAYGTGDSSPSTTDVAKDEAANVKDTAVGAGKQVAATAKDEAANVAGEVKQQATSLLSSATSELKSQATTQQGRLVETLRGYADQLQGLTQGQPLEAGPLNDLVQQAASRGSAVVSWIEDREPADVLDEVRRYARRRPVMFLALCGLAGAVAGRITRGAIAANTSVDSPSPTRAVTSYESSTSYSTTEPAYGQTGSTYGAYTDAPAGGYSTGSPYTTTEGTSIGYADQGDTIR